MFQAITQARNTLHGHRNVLDDCNIHVWVSPYTRERSLAISRVISMESTCGWKGRLYTAMLQRNKMGIVTCCEVSWLVLVSNLQIFCQHDKRVNGKTILIKKIEGIFSPMRYAYMHWVQSMPLSLLYQWPWSILW